MRSPVEVKAHLHFFLSVILFPLSQAASFAILPSALFVSDIRSVLDSAVELGCPDRNSRRPRASLSGYCAVVRTPLRSPTTARAVPPAFEPRPLPLVSWHFFLLALQASVPISAGHCLLQKAPGCKALP